MFQPTLCLVTSAAERAQLETLVASGRTPQKTALRARIVLLLVNRVKPAHIAQTLGLSRMRIRLWAQRYVATGVPVCCTMAPVPRAGAALARADRRHCGDDARPAT